MFQLFKKDNQATRNELLGKPKPDIIPHPENKPVPKPNTNYDIAKNSLFKNNKRKLELSKEKASRLFPPSEPNDKTFYHFAEIITDGTFDFEIHIENGMYRLASINKETKRVLNFEPLDNQKVKDRLSDYLTKHFMFTIENVYIHNDWKLEPVTSLDDLFYKLDNGLDTNFLL